MNLINRKVNQNQLADNSESPDKKSPKISLTTADVNSTDSTTSVGVNKPSKKRLTLKLLILLIIIAGLIALYNSESGNKASTTSGTPSALTATINKWTGGGNNYNWSDAKNWSLGVPKNNQQLQFNVSNKKLQSNGVGYDFNNDVPGLIVSALVIDGRSNYPVSFNIKGNSLTIIKGIYDTATSSSKIGGSTDIQIDIPIIFGNNAKIQTSGNNDLTFYYDKQGESINLGSNTIQFVASGDSEIDVSAAIAGTGKVLLPNNAVSHNSIVMFSTSSPNFNGNVVIGSGDLVHVSNQSNTGSKATLDAFGNSNINIQNGGAMVMFAAGSSNFSVSNPITLSGYGIKKANDVLTGAVSACITIAQEGCGADENITFTKPVKLLGDAQVGESTPSSLGTDNIHVNYIFNNLVKNGYKLNIVTNYYNNSKL